MRIALLVGLIAIAGCNVDIKAGSLRESHYMGVPEKPAQKPSPGFTYVIMENKSSIALKYFLDDNMQGELDPGGRLVVHCKLGDRRFMATEPNGNFVTRMLHVVPKGITWVVTN